MKRTLLILMLLPGVLVAQTGKEKADEYFSASDWSAAVEAYKEYVKQEPSDSSAWYNMARSQVELGKYDEALRSYEKAMETNFRPGFVYTGLAKTHALRDDEGEMYGALDQIVENQIPVYSFVSTDEAFEPFSDQDRFRAIVEKVKLNTYPCLSGTDYRHFDFWVGEWDVYFQGNKVGENSITIATGGCAVHENYTTARNYAGQSINFYDPIEKKWHQHWVGSSGDVFNYVEVNRAEGMLQFESPFLDPQGRIGTSRLTFTLNEDGTVRQLFESSYDDGATWSNSFDGLYKKKS